MSVTGGGRTAICPGQRGGLRRCDPGFHVGGGVVVVVMVVVAVVVVVVMVVAGPCAWSVQITAIAAR